MFSHTQAAHTPAQAGVTDTSLYTAVQQTCSHDHLARTSKPTTQPSSNILSFCGNCKNSTCAITSPRRLNPSPRAPRIVRPDVRCTYLTCCRKIGFMPTSLVKSDQLHLLFIQDLIIDCQGFLALANLAMLPYSKWMPFVKNLTFLCFSNFTFHM